MTRKGGSEEGTDLHLLSRAELESRIRERTAYLEDVMNTMVDVLLRTDADGRVEMANEAVGDVLGYDPDDVIGRPIDVLFAPPDENEQLAEMFDRGAFIERLLTDGQLTDVEIYFETADGDVIPMSVSASVTTDGGDVTGIVCVAKDISERKAAEERAAFLHSLLRHDLGNKLQVTGGNLELLADCDLEEGARTYLENAIGGVEDAGDLIEKVRTLERVDGDEDRRPVALSKVLTEAIERNEALCHQRDVAVETDIEDVTVRGGRLLPELFANLVENALKHSGGSRVEITSRTTEERAVVTIADDGDGIPPEERDRIFEKGHSGRDSTGSGLGMYLVDRLATSYDAEIEVGEAELDGARFDVALQLAH